ncbi:MAG: glycosyl hydrolase, partial [Acidobacteria bacterium]|nr:glycosyl hydrolase [Acidobacteriota bacterium]
GDTDPPLLPGEAAPASGDPLVLTRVQPAAIIGGIAARVLHSIMAPGFPGTWQIDAEVPADVSPGPAVPLTITAGGFDSNSVTIAVE